MRKGQRGKKIGPSSSRAALSPKDRLRQQAYGLRNTRNFAQAKPLLEELYKLEPDNLPLALDLGEAYMETEDFASATSLYAKLIEKDPKNINAVTNLGGSLIRQGKLNDARSILEYALQLDPKSIHARINLGSVLQASGERKANLDNALEAVQIDPSSSLAFNNLGSVFSDMAMFKEARHAYETAIMLDPNQVDALINLAAVEARLGDSKASAEMYERVIKKLPKEAEQRIEATKFYAAFEYLKQGVLEKGWDYYEGGFSPLVPAKGARTPRRNFDVPRWEGQPLNGKTLLVWREQGLGDELLFATCLHELEALGGNIIVECDARLVIVFQRSFPQYTIRAETFMPNHGMKSPFSDFDLHLPMGSLMKHFRRDIKDFERSGAYVKPDPVKVAKFQERLAPYKDDYRLVGICWRSGKLDPVRNLSYTMLDEWGEVLQTPGFKFVNLQYGECEGELKEAEEKYGIEILRWPDLNLRNDLDDIFALMTCLDAVVSVQTAVLTMSGCAGITSVGIKAGGWTSLGYKTHSPWFSKFVKEGQITRVIQALEENLIAEFVAEALLEPAFQRLMNKELNDEISSLPEQQRKRLHDHLRECLFEQGASIKTKLLYINILKRLLSINPILSQVIALQALESNLIFKTPRQTEERHRLSLATALSFASTGNWDSADRHFNDATKLNREATNLALPEYAWRNFVDGRLAEAKAHAEAAVTDCRAFESLNDFNIAKIFAHLGEHEIAIEIAEACFYKCKKKRDLFASMCSTFQFLGEHEKALEMLEKQKAVRPLKLNELVMQIQSLMKVAPIGDVLNYIENLYSESDNALRGLFSNLAFSSIPLLGLQASKDICNLDVASGRSSPETAYFDVLHASLSDSAYSIEQILENDLLDGDMKKARALFFSSIAEINLGNPKAAQERINHASMLKPSNIFIKILSLALSGGDLKIEGEIRRIYRSTEPYGVFFRNMFYIYGLGFCDRSKATAISFQEEDIRLGRYLPLEWVNLVIK